MTEHRITRSRRRARCTVKGCRAWRAGRGWCARHYARWRKYGTPELRRATAECTVKDCARTPRTRYGDYCEMHYTRRRRTGSVEHSGRFGWCTAPGGCDRADVMLTGLCRMHNREHEDALYAEFVGRAA